MQIIFSQKCEFRHRFLAMRYSHFQIVWLITHNIMIASKMIQRLYRYISIVFILLRLYSTRTNIFKIMSLGRFKVFRSFINLYNVITRLFFFFKLFENKISYFRGFFAKLIWRCSVAKFSKEAKRKWGKGRH